MEANKPIIRAALPNVPAALPVFEVKSATLSERERAIELFKRKFRVVEPKCVRVETSLRYWGGNSEVEFYRPSGSLWARDYGATRDYKDERRPWEKTRTLRTDAGPVVALDETTEKQVAERARSLFEEAGIRSEYAYLADVSVNQVHMLSPDGRKELFPGEATARFLYRFGETRVAGPGAKGYAFFHAPDKMAGIYHAWRDVVKEHRIRAVSAEAALEFWWRGDREILGSLRRGARVEITTVELVHYARSPSKVQDYLFPAFRVVGSILDGKDRLEGAEFARFCHIVPPQEYAKANLYADTLMIRP
jgi:hypothetical protein